MKTDSLEHADPPRLALWTGLALALGIVLHRIFFLAAAALALAAPISRLFEWLRKHEQATALRDRHS